MGRENEANMAKQIPIDLLPFVGKRVIVKFHLTENHLIADFTIEGELKKDGNIYIVDDEPGCVTFEANDVTYTEPFDDHQMLHFQYV